MSFEEILVAVQKVVFEKKGIKLDFDAVLLENGFDSVSVIDLIVNIEEQFDVEFESTDLNYKMIKSIRTISEYLQSII